MHMHANAAALQSARGLLESRWSLYLHMHVRADVNALGFQIGIPVSNQQSSA